VNPDDVPPGPLVVDTDVASFIHLGRPLGEPFKPLLRGHLLCLSFATVGELLAGADVAKWGHRRRDQLDAFIRRHVVLPVDDAVTAQWARVHAAVRDQVDINDEWIAACALAQPQPLAVVSNNLKHFQPIAAKFPDLVLVHPTL